MIIFQPFLTFVEICVQFLQSCSEAFWCICLSWIRHFTFYEKTFCQKLIKDMQSLWCWTIVHFIHNFLFRYQLCNLLKLSLTQLESPHRLWFLPFLPWADFALKIFLQIKTWNRSLLTQILSLILKFPVIKAINFRK